MDFISGFSNVVLCALNSDAKMSRNKIMSISGNDGQLKVGKDTVRSYDKIVKRAIQLLSDRGATFKSFDDCKIYTMQQ